MTINLPPALAARRAELVKHQDDLRDDAQRCTQEAAEYLCEADQCMAEIAGIDVAAEAFAELLAQVTGERIAREAVSATPDPPKERRKRRDIRGMVLEAVQRCASSIGELQTDLKDVSQLQIENALAHHEAGGRIQQLRNGRWWAIGGDGKDADREPVPAELDALRKDIAG